MTRTVWKYPIPVEDTFTLDLPTGAEVLTVANQGHPLTGADLHIWALVDPAASPEPRAFRLAGTGHPIDTDAPLRYVGTVIMLSGSFVVHLFEVLAGETQTLEG